MADEAKEPVKAPAVAPKAPEPAKEPVLKVTVAPVPAPKPVAAPVAHTPEGVTLAVSKGADGVAIKTLTWRVGDEIEDAILTSVARALVANRRNEEFLAINRVCAPRGK